MKEPSGNNQDREYCCYSELQLLSKKPKTIATKEANISTDVCTKLQHDDDQ